MKKDESWDCMQTEDTLTASGYGVSCVVGAAATDTPDTNINTNKMCTVSKKSDILLWFFLFFIHGRAAVRLFFPLNQGMRIGGGLHFNSAGHRGRCAF